MDEPYQEKHGAFLLKCAPEQGVDGQYQPKLIARQLDRSGSHDIAIDLPASRSFPIASSAAEFALSFGKRWLRERLMPSPDSH